jgi:uncharacterized sporulation protein YeaH/YhbH (DUF444 family)
MLKPRFTSSQKIGLEKEVTMSTETHSAELVEQLKNEVERIKSLPLAEQVAAYSALRELLESTLNQADGN